MLVLNESFTWLTEFVKDFVYIIVVSREIAVTYHIEHDFGV